MNRKLYERLSKFPVKRFFSDNNPDNSKLNSTYKKPFNFNWIQYISAGVIGVGVGYYIGDDGKVSTKLEKDESEIEPQGFVTDRVYIDIKINQDNDSERVIIGLYGKDCPSTCKNFISLCVGDKTLNGLKLHYLNSTFHRIIPNFMIQGGDYSKHDGKGGMSIYGQKFADENFQFSHKGLGVVSMANSGPNSNSSQFFICLKATPWLDGKHVVFGQVLYGIPTLRKMESLGSRSGHVNGKVQIVGCGKLPPLSESLGANRPEVEDLDETGRSIHRIMK